MKIEKPIQKSNFSGWAIDLSHIYFQSNFFISIYTDLNILERLITLTNMINWYVSPSK